MKETESGTIGKGMRYAWKLPPDDRSSRAAIRRHPWSRRGTATVATIGSLLAGLAAIASLAVLPGCGRDQGGGHGGSAPTGMVSALRTLPVDGLDGVITHSGVSFDSEITHDGNGSLRVEAAKPATIRLYELEGVAVDEARLIYRARLRTEDVDGRAYLEMLCRFPGQGEFFSRALHQPLTGSVNWTSQETPFFLKKGQTPDLVKLNLVVEGTGTVWVDEIEVLESAL